MKPSILAILTRAAAYTATSALWMTLRTIGKLYQVASTDECLRTYPGCAQIGHQYLTRCCFSPSWTQPHRGLEFSATYIYTLVRDQLFNNSLAGVTEMYRVFSAHPHAKHLVGRILEDAMHRLFAAGGRWDLYSLVQSSRKGSQNMHWKTSSQPAASTH